MNITGSGNLVLFDQNGIPIWQSFDHPADTLVLGQRLRGGQRVVANKTMAEWTTGQVYITVLSDGLYAFAGFNPPQQYYPNTIASTTGNNSAYMNYLNGGLEIFTGSANGTIALPSASSVQFMRLEFDGRLRVYDWNQSLGWQAIYDVLKLDVCDFPLVCGEYGICSYGECTCPRGEDESSTTFFQQVDINLPSRVQGIDEEESCKQACLNNCSCKAALFQYGEKVSNGDCYLLSELFSLKKNEPLNTHYNSTAYIKVQIPTAPSPNSAPSANKKGAGIGVIVSIIGAVLFAFFIGGIIIVLLRRKKAIEEEEDDFRQVPGMPTRFTFEELKLATDNFCKKLGERLRQLVVFITSSW
ncbi:hypothetical protein Cni_G01395 [Canna indica]|uniref:Apple domain-containing protein n=1 Tax=Canna indica TaxID=4628 RepID=A0AAQ3JMF3_9LILI|nr:hypothetical protein Cni_G01395 [Canna indica]